MPRVSVRAESDAGARAELPLIFGVVSTPPRPVVVDGGGAADPAAPPEAEPANRSRERSATRNSTASAASMPPENGPLSPPEGLPPPPKCRAWSARRDTSRRTQGNAPAVAATGNRDVAAWIAGPPDGDLPLQSSSTGRHAPNREHRSAHPLRTGRWRAPALRITLKRSLGHVEHSASALRNHKPRPRR